jgi:hypothetical protein
MIRRIPSTWDETKVLNGSAIGNLAAFAKRKGNDWYVGILNGTNNRRQYTLNLSSFLDGGQYYGLMVKDRYNIASALDVERGMYSSSQSITVSLEPGGGYSACFSKINILPESSWSIGSQFVTIQNLNTGADVRYTLDGSEPNTTSPAYTAPIAVTNSCVLRAKVVSGQGTGTEARGYFKIVPSVPALPDVYISDLSWLSQTVGWGSTPQINHSIQGNNLVVGGTSYQKGIGTHAASEIVYALNSEYRFFVAVAGIDDEIASDRASVVFKIYVDDVLLAQSPVVRRHQFWHFNVRLPRNGNQIKLVAATADDTNHSDHADWVNAGFITSRFYDLYLLADNWLREDCNGSDTCDGMDLNNDRHVDFEDFAIIARDWIY